MKRINKIRVNNFAGMIKMTDSGETLIKKCQRILDEGEPLTDGAPMIYTPKQAGVKPECNVRADKWDIAMKAMDRVQLQTHGIPKRRNNGSTKQTGRTKRRRSN